MDGINNLLARGIGADNPAWDLREAQTSGLRNELMRQQLAAQPFKHQLDEQSLAMRSLALDIQSKLMSQKYEGGPFTFDYPGFSITAATKEGARKATELVAQFPDQVKDPGFMPFMAQLGVSIKAREPKQWVPKTQEEALEFEEKKAGAKPKDIETWVTPSGQTVNLPKGSMPPAGSVPFKGKGLDIQFDETGKPIRISQGEVGPSMGKVTQNKIEQKIIDGKEQLARMHAIALEFKPEYQEWGTRLTNVWTGIKASLGKNVDPEAAKQMTDFKKYQRKAIENINLYIKELTGAQMSEQEASRLRLAQPDPGEKWYQGDDPITFKAKMDDIIKATRAAVARYAYYRQKGLGDGQIRAIVNSGTAINLEELAARME